MFNVQVILTSIMPRDVLETYGVSFSGKRGPCPLCKTSANSQSFSLFDTRWTCFACGQKGDVIDLEKALSGVANKGFAIAALAGRIGLSGSRETALTISARFAAETARENEIKQGEINRARWLGRVTRCDKLRARIAQVGAYGPRPFVWSVLENLYRLLGETEAKLDQTQFDVRSWKVQDDPSFPRSGGGS
jgi:hypothetical protein